MARLPTFDPIDFLVHQKYNLASGSGSGFPRSAQTPEQLAANKAYWQKQQESADHYRRELELKEKAEIDQMVEDVRAADRLKQMEADERAEKAHPFNQPDALATPEKYTYWCKARYWNMSEATALLIGRDPKHISREKVKNARKSSRIGTGYLQSYELVERAFRQISTRRFVAPSDYIQWALNVGLPVAEDLLAAFNARGPQIKEWSEERATLTNEIEQLRERIKRLEQETAEKSADLSPKPLGVRERESLLKLVIGMAIDGYGFDPKASRSPTARELSDHLLRLELQLSDDTIRAYLAEAKDLLPGELPD